MISTLTIMQGRAFQTFRGTYYTTPPTATIARSVADLMAQTPPQYFSYEIVDPELREYRNLLRNLMDDTGADLTIKTNTPLNWKVGAFVVLSDGEMYCITSYTEDKRAASREAARLLPIPPATDYVLRLVEYQNARGLE